MCDILADTWAIFSHTKLKDTSLERLGYSPPDGLVRKFWELTEKRLDAAGALPAASIFTILLRAVVSIFTCVFAPAPTILSLSEMHMFACSIRSENEGVQLVSSAYHSTGKLFDL